MKALVLGGCGFIGSHIVDQLVASGHSVRVFDRAPEKYRPPVNGVDYVFGDFREPIDLIKALVDVEVVYHLVSATFPGTAALNPQADVRDNILPTLGLLDTMTRLGVSRLLYLSSGGTVYGVPDTVPTSESHPLRPINSYGIVKAATEHYLELYGRTHGLRPVIIRPSNPYGPRQSHVGIQGIITTFLHRLARNEPIEVWGDGSIVRDYIYVGDLAQLCLLAASSEKVGAYNCGSGQGTSIIEVIKSIELVTDRTVNAVFKSGRPVDAPKSILDISLAMDDFNWRFTKGLTEGISQSWKWIKSVSSIH